MPALNLLNLLALASVAILALSSVPVQVNALAADRAQVARHVRGRDAIAKRKRGDTSGSCQPSPTSSLPPSPTSTPAASTPASTPTTSAAPTSAAPSTSSSSNTGPKWGLAWAADSNDYLSNFAFSDVGYLYTWSPTIPSPLPNGIQGIPMLWGWDQVDGWQSKVVAGYASYALGFNEPNESGQSNIDASTGATMWKQYMNPLRALGYHLISPACTNDDAGLTWYSDFFTACDGGCYVDSMAFHAYTTNASDLINFATTLHNSYNMDVWITEFADENFSGTGGQADMNEVLDYAGEVINFVTTTSWVRAAFPFGLMSNLQGVNTDNSLITSDGQPTALADLYFSS